MASSYDSNSTPPSPSSPSSMPIPEYPPGFSPQRSESSSALFASPIRFLPGTPQTPVNSSDVEGSPLWNVPPPPLPVELPPWHDDGSKSWSYSDPSCYTPSPLTNTEGDFKSLLLGTTIASSSIDDRTSWWDATATSRMRSSPTLSNSSTADETSGDTTTSIKNGGTPESSWEASSADSPPSSSDGNSEE